MAESKRTFQSAKMDKDIDDRILPAGTYRDALNVSVDFSEDANVGALENLKGNELLANQNILGLSAATNPNAKVVGSITHPEEQKIYYFVTGDKTDGIFEYDAVTGAISTVIVDSLTESPSVGTNFLFENAGVSAVISQNGYISLTADVGNPELTSANPGVNNTGSARTINISVKVRIPIGYANYGGYVYGTISGVQPSPTAPTPNTENAININTTSARLRGSLDSNDVNVTSVGFYWGYNSTSNTTLTISELINGGTNIVRNTVNSTLNDEFNSDITSIPNDKLVSFAAFATNSTGTGEGSIKTFTTSAAPLVNRPPNNHLFIVPGISSADGPPQQTPSAESGVDARQVGYGDWEKADGNFYFNTLATSDTGIYSNNPAASGSTLTSPGVTIYSSGGFGTALDCNYVLGNSLSSGQYTFTAALAGQTSHEVQIVTSSNATREAIFSLNFTSTGTGTTPFLATLPIQCFTQHTSCV